MSTTETKAPLLLKATIEGYQICNVALGDYKAKKGQQNMSELIAKAPKTIFCKTYRVEKSNFVQLSDEELQSKLDTNLISQIIIATWKKLKNFIFHQPTKSI